MAIVTVGVMVNLPMPVFVAASKNFTGVGAVAAAGTPTGYVMALSSGFVQWPPPLIHNDVGAALMFEAPVFSVFEPEVNVVDVIVRFQPTPEPLGSFTVSPIE